MSVMWELETSGMAAGAVGVLVLCADSEAEINALGARIGLAPPPLGKAWLRDLLGADRGIVARWSHRTLHLMPHGGPAVVRLLTARLTQCGIGPAEAMDPRSRFPEAASLLEARVLAALARAASPLAIEPLLAQPDRWPRELHDLPDPPLASPGSAPRELNRLINPPLVVALGPANIGKSSLVNAMAGRGISIVADEPGTTRDHVGVMLDLAGLVVRYIDTPGIRRDGDELESDAVRIALETAAAADLLLACGDASAPPIRGLPDRPTLSVALRGDLGAPLWPAEVAVSARTGEGLPELVGRIRDTLVPPAALADKRPWRFWE